MRRGIRGKTRDDGGTSGFTTLELLLIIALMAMLGTIFSVTMVNIFESKGESVEESFLKACLSAQEMAALSGRDVSLRFDTKERHLVWTNGEQRGTKTFADKTDDASIQFLQGQRSNSSILLGGTLIDTAELPFVTFYSDGTCSAFRAQMRAKGSAYILSIDPWTCAPILDKEARR